MYISFAHESNDYSGNMPLIQLRLIINPNFHFWLFWLKSGSKKIHLAKVVARRKKIPGEALSLSQIDTQIMTTVLDYLTVPVHTAAENGSIRYFTVYALKWVIVLVFISAKQYLRTVLPKKMHHDGFILQ